jgi:hypothetical protein
VLKGRRAGCPITPIGTGLAEVRPGQTVKVVTEQQNSEDTVTLVKVSDGTAEP